MSRDAERAPDDVDGARAARTPAAHPSLREDLLHFLRYERRWWGSGLAILTALALAVAWFSSQGAGDVFLYELK